ncbi:mechanosensitive ion channel family protein [Gemmiger sp. An194]|uniref:mechanosensitive ion channel family protein n=1 Tax=Gemmiger sp. An194 TaxID=1965582 RepID=UPI0013029C5F|nr:mechanosensitive ion channel family protein [Gemmiger sp. An194]
MIEKITGYILNTEGALFQLAISLIVFAVSYLISRLVRYKVMPWLMNLLNKKEKKGPYVLAKGFSRPAPVAVWTTGIFLACILLPLPADLALPFGNLMSKLLRVTMICLLAWGLIGSSDLGPVLFHDVRGKLDLEVDNTVANFLNKILKGTILVFAILMLLQELGFPVGSLITSLGIVGLTLSLAAKDYATNFFGGLVVIFEKPFAIGDWIWCKDGEGEVEDIAFRSTRIRQLNDSVLVIPNSILVSNAMINYSQINRRLAKFTLGVTYDTTRSQLESLLADIRAMLAAREDVHPDTIRVQMTGFGASSIDILIQFYATTGALAEFLKIQESINLELMDLVYKNGCSFAFPSTSVYIEKAPASAPRS